MCCVPCLVFIWTLALKGAVNVGDDPIAHEPFHTLVLSQEDNETGVKLTAAEDGTELVLVSPLARIGSGFGAVAY